MVNEYMARTQWPTKNLSFTEAAPLLFQFQVRSDSLVQLWDDRFVGRTSVRRHFGLYCPYRLWSVATCSLRMRKVIVPRTGFSNYTPLPQIQN